MKACILGQLNKFFIKNYHNFAKFLFDNKFISESNFGKYNIENKFYSLNKSTSTQRENNFNNLFEKLLANQ